MIFERQCQYDRFHEVKMESRLTKDREEQCWRSISVFPGPEEDEKHERHKAEACNFALRQREGSGRQSALPVLPRRHYHDR